MSIYSYNRTAGIDSVYNAIYGVITRVMAHIQPGLLALDGAKPHLGSFSQSGHMTGVYVSGGLRVGGKVDPSVEWSIDIQARALTNDVGIEVDLNGKSPYLSSGDHKKMAFSGFTDSKHIADEIVRLAENMRAKLGGRLGA